MKKIVTAFAALIIAAIALPAFADDDDDDGRRSRRSAPKVEWMSVESVATRIGEAGYTGIREIEIDDGRYEVDAVAPDGQRVKLWVHPTTAEILSSRRGQGSERHRYRNYRHDDDDDDDDDDD